MLQQRVQGGSRSQTVPIGHLRTGKISPSLLPLGKNMHLFAAVTEKGTSVGAQMNDATLAQAGEEGKQS